MDKLKNDYYLKFKSSNIDKINTCIMKISKFKFHPLEGGMTYVEKDGEFPIMNENFELMFKKMQHREQHIVKIYSKLKKLKI